LSTSFDLFFGVAIETMAKADPDTPERRSRFVAYCIGRGWGGNGERWKVVEIAKACKKPISKVSNLLNETGSFGASIARDLEQALGMPKFHLDGGGWPFENVTFERWQQLTERQKGLVESAMLSKIEEIESQANRKQALI
jgi:hypothetical protein